ncbi:abortive infection protein [Gordoniibacillus kamchatkensis]|uniref:Abortive infection protein n=1 Tax=Gordoniibacillus kamchatkensis TaxID=1590651 RepID=A0ABR5AB37_9BACL|nr:type II CAAX endopeptidase family protein [Paenibacillus sp. VKM B-2647]KIL38207.1 abortive infection protein [Paenibacillus sp. VKM B-2647]
MKRIDWNRFKLKQVDVDKLDDRTLLLNLYITQAVTMIIGIIVLLFERVNPIRLFPFVHVPRIALWALVFAAAVLLLDVLVSRWVPKDVLDDGGVNEKLFARRPLWHIALMSLVVALCEETLFRGAIQHAWGAYWTSILFAAIHFRYLRHWLMTGLVFSISYGLGWIYEQTGTLWTPVLAHFVIDFAMGCIIRYGKED